ncbi:UNVERIFIED_CONTAM: hypothetical protein K2H54_036313 [Gekko kuhli]
MHVWMWQNSGESCYQCNTQLLLPLNELFQALFMMQGDLNVKRAAQGSLGTHRLARRRGRELLPHMDRRVKGGSTLFCENLQLAFPRACILKPSCICTFLSLKLNPGI